VPNSPRGVVWRERLAPQVHAPTPHVSSTADVIDVRGLTAALRRNWRRIAIGAALGGALAVLYLRLAIPRYEATATVRIDARQNTLPTIYAEQSARDEVFTEIEVLRSRTMAADVVDGLALTVEMVQPERVSRRDIFASLAVTATADTGTFLLERRKDGTYGVEGSTLVVTPGTSAQVGGVNFVLAKGVTAGVIQWRLHPREAAIASLRRDVEIGRAGLQASIIALRYESRDPELARDVLNAWTTSFIQRRQSIHRAEATSTAAFIQAQLDTLMPQLKVAEDRLLAYRNANRIVAPEVEASTQVNQRALLQATRNEIESERSALQQAMSRVRVVAADAPADAPSPYRELLGFPTLLKNQAASELLRSLATLDDQRSTLLMRRTMADPDVITLSERVRGVEKQLQGLTATYLRGLTAQVTATDRALGSYASSMRAIPTQEVEYARLQRAPRVYEELVSLLQTRLKEAQITEAVTDASVRVVDQAVTPWRPSSPNAPLVLAFGVMGGLLFGSGLAFFREHGVATVRSRRDLQGLTDVPVLGMIPSFHPSTRRIGILREPEDARSRPASLALTSARSTRASELAAVEAFARLLMNVTWTAGRPIHSLLVTSPLPGDGKTTTVLHLAAAAVAQQLRVLVIDADLRCGGLTAALSLRETRGLVDILTGASPLSECVPSVVLPGGGHADAIGAGSLSRAAGVPQVVKGLNELLDETGDYDLVLIDTPPVNIVADAAAMASLTQGLLLVTRAGETPQAAVDVALEQLHRAGARILGTVLNGAELQRNEGYGSLAQYHAYTLERA
jgi:polysaccharide biosynthesis transport protein